MNDLNPTSGRLAKMRDLVPMWFRYRVMELRGRSIYSGYPDRYKCVFIHIPKTAGTSVTKALFGTDSRHVTWDKYYHANRRKFTRYFKFAFVRNPWDRLLSGFIFLKRGGMDPADSIWASRNLECIDTFEQFVHEWVNEVNIWSWVHFLPQHYFVCDQSMQCVLDFVGRMENLQSDFLTVSIRLGRNATLPDTNRTRSDHYSRHYTDAMRDRVAQIYQDDIRLFGYQFEAQ
jgi:hypothetical protein